MSQLEQVISVPAKLYENVKKEFNKTNEEIKQDVKILNEWWSKQAHLPQKRDDVTIEKILMRNKFRVEQTKKKIDAYYTLRGLYPEFFGLDTFDINSKTMQNALKCYYLFPLKTPSKTGERLYFMSIKDDKRSEYFSLLEIYQYSLSTFDIVQSIDTCSSIRFICDMKNFSFAFYKKMDPITTYRGLKIVQEGFSCRLSGIEYLNAPSFVDLLIKLVGPLLKDGRIRTHDNLNSLGDIINIDDMPNEYGGKAGTLEEMERTWTSQIDAQKDFLIEKLKCVSDESKRVGKNQYDDMFGSEGTFKKLNLD